MAGQLKLQKWHSSTLCSYILWWVFKIFVIEHDQYGNRSTDISLSGAKHMPGNSFTSSVVLKCLCQFLAQKFQEYLILVSSQNFW